jgi:hypothetical protein
MKKSFRQNQKEQSIFFAHTFSAPSILCASLNNIPRTSFIPETFDATKVY